MNIMNSKLLEYGFNNIHILPTNTEIFLSAITN